MTKFIKVNAFTCIEEEFETRNSPTLFWGERVITKYSRKDVGPAFINVDYILEVNTEEMPGIGRVTHIYDHNASYLTVTESLEEVMLQIEGKR